MSHSLHSLPTRSAPLDVLRTFAIFLVFTSHFRIFAGHKWFSTIGPIGWTGVDLFFVLSGFLIASQLFRMVALGRRISWKEFYIRRGLRIWPNYFFVLFLYFTVPVVIERGMLPPLWKFLTFTQNFGLNYRFHGAFSHAWSLCVEEQFYLVLPFVILFLNRYSNFKRSAAIFCCVILSGILLRYFLWSRFIGPLILSESGTSGPTFYREIYYPTYCRLDGLAMGVAIAAVYRLQPNLWSKIMNYANIYLALGILGGVASYLICQNQDSMVASVFGFPLLAASFSLLVLAAISPTGIFSRVRIPGAELGATLAFSFYLTHKSIIHLTKNWLLNAGVSEETFLYPLGIFLACVAVSLILYILIERPFLLWRDRIIG